MKLIDTKIQMVIVVSDVGGYQSENRSGLSTFGSKPDDTSLFQNL